MNTTPDYISRWVLEDIARILADTKKILFHNKEGDTWSWTDRVSYETSAAADLHAGFPSWLDAALDAYYTLPDMAPPANPALDALKLAVAALEVCADTLQDNGLNADAIRDDIAAFKDVIGKGGNVSAAADLWSKRARCSLLPPHLRGEKETWLGNQGQRTEHGRHQGDACAMNNAYDLGANLGQFLGRLCRRETR